MIIGRNFYDLNNFEMRAPRSPMTSPMCFVAAPRSPMTSPMCFVAAPGEHTGRQES